MKPAKSGNHTFKINISYQACDENICNPPVQKQIPIDVKLFFK